MNTYVYFIAELSNVKLVHRVKIGVATNPQKRLAVLQTGNSRQLCLLFTIGPMSKSQAYGVEQHLHNEFCRCQIRGEWFRKQVLRKVGKIEKVAWSGSIQMYSDKFQFNWRYGSEKRPPRDKYEMLPL